MNAAITKLPAFRRYRLQNNKQTKKEGFLNTAHFDPLADLTTTPRDYLRSQHLP